MDRLALGVRTHKIVFALRTSKAPALECCDEFVRQFDGPPRGFRFRFVESLATPLAANLGSPTIPIDITPLQADDLSLAGSGVGGQHDRYRPGIDTGIEELAEFHGAENILIQHPTLASGLRQHIDCCRNVAAHESVFYPIAKDSDE